VGERLGDDDGPGFRPVDIEVAQGLCHPPAATHGAGQLLSRTPRS
jgi:hypothetical protein